VWVCLVSFAVELALSIFALENYAGGFYFWLDSVATLSLLADIPAFMRALGMDPCRGVDSYGSSFDEATQTVGTGGGESGVADGGFAKAGRASRAATRAGRIVRIIRLIRLVKIFKTYEINRERNERRDSLMKLKRDSLMQQNVIGGMDENTANAYIEEDEDSLLDFEQSESRVGQKLGDLTTKRVIIGVLLMLFMLPVFDVGLYAAGERQDFAEGGLTMAHEALINSVSEIDGFYQSLNQYYTGTKGMYRLVVNGTDYSNDGNLSFVLDGYAHKELRCTEFEFFTFSTPDENVPSSFSFVFFDRQHESRMQALLDIMRTTFVCLILTVGAVLFSKDTNALVLRPLDRMVNKIQAMSENPLTQFEITGNDENNQMETRLLENSISRICSLLAVGFGDAGSEIIAENMKRGGAIDPMIPGKKMVAIFGFCDIRQFTDTTEVLQEDIMEFVNTIAKIVHVEVHVHGGSANKNIGDAFLLVWKFPKDISAEEISNSASIDETKRRKIQIIADNALASFVTIIGALRRSARLHRYRGNKALNERINDFEVKMGFGLHVGWAIEGAIGSEHKVDASYLSPNVNISARLEAATKQFGVPLLFTGEFASLLSSGVQHESRQIDCVTVKGSLHPVELYTFDVHPENIESPDDNVNLHRTFEEETLSFMEYSDEFKQHPDILKMRQGISPDFLRDFKCGLRHYFDGEWSQAKEILETTRTYVTAQGKHAVDGPSESLLAVMKTHNFIAPKTWKGYRELTEK
jgi:class 3 adenylate cyclase